MRTLYIVLVFMFFALRAYGYPSFQSGITGSSYYLFATNTEDTVYLCDVDYTLFHNDYGTSGKNIIHASFRVNAKWSGNVIVASTGYSASGLSESTPTPRCTVLKPSMDGASSSSKKDGGYVCPAGLTLIGNAYGSRDSGKGGFLQRMSVKFPPGFKLDTKYKQTKPTDIAGGGATTPWNGLSDIPDGVNIYATGGHYWAVGVPLESKDGSDGFPELNFNQDGTAKSLKIGMYCGAAGWPGPGCNVNVFVCARGK